MGKISRKFKLIQESVDFDKEYELEEALGIFDQFKSPKVTESLDIAFKLGILADKSDQNVRGAITLPHSLGCLLYTSPSPRDRQKSRMPSSA